MLAFPSAFTSVASVLLEADAPAVNSLLRRAWGSPSTLGGTEVAPTYEVKSAQTVLPLDLGAGVPAPWLVVEHPESPIPMPDTATTAQRAVNHLRPPMATSVSMRFTSAV